MRLTRIILCFATLPVLAAALLGCSGSRQALGLEKAVPLDEFSVAPRSPLTVPEEFHLPVPHPGVEAFVPKDLAAERRHFLLGDAATAPESGASLSPGESALLQRAGAGAAAKGIREIVNQEALDEAKNSGTTIDKLTFWRDPVALGIVVDPAKEAQRLQENRAAGQPVTKGETPTLRSKKSIF